ncbi:hypothetical protein ACTJKC_02345 [Pedobacter sp. 22226]|uniref:hypothetical protein n=1 Tax=Pedobacter sp. 22226 TaxID=3453894 RepID=UPI003F8573AC
MILNKSIFLSTLLLFSGFGMNAQQLYSTDRVDSIRLDFIRYALLANHQKNALKAFNGLVRNARDTAGMRAFFKSRSDGEVTGIGEYRKLILKIDELSGNTNLTLDSIYSFYGQQERFAENLRKDEIGFQNFKDSVNHKYFRPQVQAGSQITIDTARYKDTATPSGSQNANPFSGAVWEYLLCIAGGALLVALLFQIRKKPDRKNKRSNTIIKSEMQDDSRFNLSQDDFREVIGLKEENKKLRKEIEQLKEEINEKNKALKTAELTIARLENGGADEKDVAVDTIEVPVEKSEQKGGKQQYFPSPLSDGSFRRVDGRESFLEGASIYRFNIVGEAEATFDFCEDFSSVSMALNNRNELILSVAEEVEGNYTTAKKILTYKGESGKAVLEDNKWNVVRKIKIKYL